jgi:hypothetical protein
MLRTLKIEEVNMKVLATGASGFDGMQEVGGYGNLLEGRPIGLLNHGNKLSDFNYEDQIAERTVRLLDRVATPTLSKTIEATISQEENKNMPSMQRGETVIGQHEIGNILPAKSVPITHSGFTRVS